MEYDKLRQPTPATNSGNPTAGEPRRRRRLLLSAITTLVFLSASLTFLLNNSFHPQIHTPPRRKLTLQTLPAGGAAAGAGGGGATRDLVHFSLNMTLHHAGAALFAASAMAGAAMDPRARAAYDDCMELLDISVDQLTRSVQALSGGGASRDDVVTWLGAALTNHDTCAEGFDGVADGFVRREMVTRAADLSRLVAGSLEIFSAADRGQIFAGIPIENRRRRRLLSEFPSWVKLGDRKLLQIPGATIGADFVVSKDGNGTHKTVADAVKAAPEGSPRRFVIYVKAGRYEENVKVGRKKINLMFVGDGKGKTVITGSRSIFDNYTTFHTATFAAQGTGLIMKDMTIENSAGPLKHQAVALRIGADHSVVYRCNIIGYQDTLYVHSQRQFFRDSDIYGTVDFIFGNAAVVLQKCNLWARKPLPLQKITITAQNRKDPNQNTGISIHSCRILPAADLPANSGFQTFLGRPWKLYSRVVYMMSYIGGHVEPRGWLEWNQSFALDTLYYGEYMNSGPGAAVGGRVRWPGYKVITLPAEAGKFTVANFIFGSSWLPGTGVSFLAGLSF